MAMPIGPSNLAPHAPLGRAQPLTSRFVYTTPESAAGAAFPPAFLPQSRSNRATNPSGRRGAAEEAGAWCGRRAVPRNQGGRCHRPVAAFPVSRRGVPLRQGVPLRGTWT
ncbi:hypothetical protein ACP70R_016112 [Stipagrostis hirtigluma subsp. patula]